LIGLFDVQDRRLDICAVILYLVVYCKLAAMWGMAGHALRWTVRVEGIAKNSKLLCVGHVNTLRKEGSFKLFKRPLPGFLTILTL